LALREIQGHQLQLHVFRQLHFYIYKPGKKILDPYIYVKTHLFLFDQKIRVSALRADF